MRNYWLVSISVFTSVVAITATIRSSSVGLRICTITAGIKKYKSIIKKEKKKHDKIVFSAKTNLENDEVLISKALIDLYVSPYKFVLVNNVLREIIKRKKKETLGRRKFCAIY